MTNTNQHASEIAGLDKLELAFLIKKLNNLYFFSPKDSPVSFAKAKEIIRTYEITDESIINEILMLTNFKTSILKSQSTNERKHKNDHVFLEEHRAALFQRLITEDLGLSQGMISGLICENKTTYYELRKLLEYINRQVRHSTTRSVINELIKVLAKLEYSNVRIPMAVGRLKRSKPLLRRVK